MPNQILFPAHQPRRRDAALSLLGVALAARGAKLVKFWQGLEKPRKISYSQEERGDYGKSWGGWQPESVVRGEGRDEVGLGRSPALRNEVLCG